MEFIKNVFNRENAIEVKDYPYWFKLRTTMFIWLEVNKNKQMRVCTSTINPKTWRENAPKKSIYSDYIRLYINNDWHIKSYHYNTYAYEDFKKVEALNIFETKDELDFYREKIKRSMYVWLMYYQNPDYEKAKGMNIDELNEYRNILEWIEFKTREHSRS